MITYKAIRNLHLVLASFSLPFLLMYGISAVQMSHGAWFRMHPAVMERQLTLTPDQNEGRAVARQVMDREPSVRGELTAIQQLAEGISLRVVLPGIVHEVHYDRASGTTRLKTSVAGVMGMLNRLHHAAGLWHDSVPLKLWGLAVAIVSAAILLLGVTGIYMWFTRRPERGIGLVLLGANVVITIVLLTLMRAAGP